MNESLEEYRKEIDQIDEQLTKLFEARMHTAKKIGDYKLKHNLPIFHKEREQQVIIKNNNRLNDQSLKPYTTGIWQSLMDISKQYQYDQTALKESPLSKVDSIKVAFQGVPGSFSEEALIHYFGDTHNRVHYKNFEDVFKAINQGEVSYGILPIENTSTGSINQIYDLLQQYNLYIVGQTKIKIEHHLLGLPETAITEIKDIYSHPQGFEQSSEYLKTLVGCNHIFYYNTAMSARYVKESNDRSKAAIGSRRAADMYGLDILQSVINNVKENYTRFIIIGKELESNSLSDKISLLFTLPNTAGSLYDVLSLFSNAGVNLIQIESRPVGDGSFNYFFYIDIDGNIEQPHIKDTLDLVNHKVDDFRILGCYKNNI